MFPAPHVEGFMLRISTNFIGIVALGAAAVAGLGGAAIAAQDKYTVQVPDGIAFSEFRGYETWQVVSVSGHEGIIDVILGNPVAIEAYKAGIPENDKPFPDGAMMAKIHWNAKMQANFPTTRVPGALHDVDFMVKDSKKYADSGGWGYAEFEYDPATDVFRPGNENDEPPQANDAKCGSRATPSCSHETTFSRNMGTAEPRTGLSSSVRCWRHHRHRPKVEAKA